MVSAPPAPAAAGTAHTLVQKMRGHYAYYGLVDNGYSLRLFLAGVQRIWKKWLARRRRRGRYLSWEYFRHLTQRFPLLWVPVLSRVPGT